MCGRRSASTTVPDFSVSGFGLTVFGIRLGAPAPAPAPEAVASDPVVKFEKVGNALHLVATGLEASLEVGGLAVSATNGSVGLVLTDEDPGTGPTDVSLGLVAYATGTLSLSVADFAEVTGTVTLAMNTTSTSAREPASRVMESGPIGARAFVSSTTSGGREPICGVSPSDIARTPSFVSSRMTSCPALPNAFALRKARLAF